MDIPRLLQQAESKTLEFKQDLSSLPPILKTIVAFANTAGGILIIGRSEDGTLTGVGEPFRAEEKLANAIADNIRPSIYPEIEVATIEGVNLLVVQVPHWKGPFYLKRQGVPSGVYVRLGSTSRPVNEDTLAEMKRQASHASYDQEALLSLKSTDLNQMQIHEAFAQKGKVIDEQKMLTLGLLTEYNQHLVPTVGGVILFGQPETRMRYVPDARVSCARFRGTDKTYILDRFEVEGTILDAVDPVLRFIARNTRLTADITATRRIDIPEYPPLAIREALINALVHADYTVAGSHTRISIFDDRLEIMNSGMLPFGYTLEDIYRGVSRVRNRVIARTFRELDLMEEWGSGYRRITSECTEKNYPLPKWTESGTWMMVTFYPHPLATTSPRGDLAPREEEILSILQAHGPLATSDIGARLSESISSRTLNRNLAALRDSGRIVKKGSGPATRWSINPS